MVTPGQDASIALTFTARDNASPAIQRLGGNLSRLGAAAAGVGKILANNTAAFLGAALALSSIGAQASQLGVKFGLLTEEQGDFLNTAFQVTAVVLGTAAVMAQLVQTLLAAGVGIGAMGAAFVAFLPIALLVGAALAAIVTSIELIRDPTLPTTFEKITGIDVLRAKEPAGTRPGVLAPGEKSFTEDPLAAAGGIGRDILRQARAVFLGQTGGQSRISEPVIINNGTIIADENGIRSLETRLRRVRKEDERARGITK